MQDDYTTHKGQFDVFYIGRYDARLKGESYQDPIAYWHDGKLEVYAAKEINDKLRAAFPNVKGSYRKNEEGGGAWVYHSAVAVDAAKAYTAIYNNPILFDEPEEYATPAERHLVQEIAKAFSGKRIKDAEVERIGRRVVPQHERLNWAYEKSEKHELKAAPGALLVFLAHRHNNKAGCSWWSVARIAAQIRYSERKVYAATKVLEKLKLIRVERHKKGYGKITPVNHYYICI